jgi:transcription initiation factor TFIID subunit 5
METYGKEHQEVHSDEITKLKAITTPELLQESEVAKVWKENRFIVHLSRFSFGLMMAFVHDNEYYLLLSVLNRHLNIKCK